MKKILLTATLMAFITSWSFAEPQLKVWKKDKSTVLFALAEKPVTTFSGNKLIIKTSTATVEYPLADILRYTYEGVETGIETIESENSVVVRQEPDKLQLTNLKSDTEVYLYNASGRLLDILKSNGTDAVTISIASRPQGMYIVKCGNETIKLMKR
jgi:hypothetical protein